MKFGGFPVFPPIFGIDTHMDQPLPATGHILWDETIGLRQLKPRPRSVLNRSHLEDGIPPP